MGSRLNGAGYAKGTPLRSSGQTRLWATMARSSRQAKPFGPSRIYGSCGPSSWRSRMSLGRAL